MTNTLANENQRLQIIYQDHHLIAVNKPARVPVASEDSGDVTLLDLVRNWNQERQVEGKKGYCVPIHFLDRPVSGVILFAISSKAASRLNESFRSHQLTKTYLAVAECRPTEDEGILEHWLTKNKETNVTSVARKEIRDAKYCKLSYKFIGEVDRYSLLEVQPVTGRSHQIRVQMAAIGCPLFGDKKYGAQGSWDGRVALHAFSLSIKHPVGSELLNLTAPLPADWKVISSKVDFAFNNYLQKGKV